MTERGVGLGLWRSCRPHIRWIGETERGPDVLSLLSLIGHGEEAIPWDPVILLDTSLAWSCGVQEAVPNRARARGLGKADPGLHDGGAKETGLR